MQATCKFLEYRQRYSSLDLPKGNKVLVPFAKGARVAREDFETNRV